MATLTFIQSPARALTSRQVIPALEQARLAVATQMAASSGVRTTTFTASTAKRTLSITTLADGASLTNLPDMTAAATAPTRQTYTRLHAALHVSGTVPGARAAMTGVKVHVAPAKMGRLVRTATVPTRGPSIPTYAKDLPNQAEATVRPRQALSAAATIRGASSGATGAVCTAMTARKTRHLRIHAAGSRWKPFRDTTAAAAARTRPGLQSGNVALRASRTVVQRNAAITAVADCAAPVMTTSFAATAIALPHLAVY